MMKKLIPFMIFLVLLLVNGCQKPDKENNQPTQAMFWVANDFGCGPVTVQCNGVTKTITSYSPNQPPCGANGTVTFDLQGGSYPFSAHCSSKSWNGTIKVQDGKCNAFQLNTTGGTNNGNPDQGGAEPTSTTPETKFIATQDRSFSGIGSSYTQQFTISSSAKFIFRFTSQFKAQAAIIVPAQLNNFKNNKSFSGYGVFNNQVGTNNVTLSPGTYYLAVRNASQETNKISVELDYAITLPGSDKAAYAGIYFSGAKSFPAGTNYWQAFSIQKGYRYFLDGCNVNCAVRIIPDNQLAAFKNNQTFQSYNQYYDAGGNGPGLFEIKLPEGNYYLVSHNSQQGALTYTMERWRVN